MPTSGFQKFTNILIGLILFSLPWQARYLVEVGQLNNGPYEYSTIALYGTDLLILTALLTGLSVRRPDDNRGWRHKIYWLIIIALLALTCASVFVGGDRLLVLQVLFRMFIGLGLAWLIFSQNLTGSKILSIILISVCCQGLLALYQFNAQATWGNKWLGMAAHYPQDLGVSVVEAVGPNGQTERWLRSYGALDHPNMLGGWLALGLLLAAYWFANLYRQGYSRPKEIGLSFALIIASAGLFVSFSRASLVGAAIGLLLMFLTNLEQWRRYLAAAAIIAGTGLILIMPYGYLYQSRLSALEDTDVGSRLEIKSLADRATYLRDAKALIARHPLWGVGAGNYGLAVARDITPKQLSYRYQPVHNVFLLVLAEIGLIGLAAWLLLLGRLAWDSLRHLSKPDHALSLSILILLFTLMFFDHWLWSLHFGILFFWLAVGLIIKLNQATLIFSLTEEMNNEAPLNQSGSQAHQNVDLPSASH